MAKSRLLLNKKQIIPNLIMQDFEHRKSLKK